MCIEGKYHVREIGKVACRSHYNVNLSFYNRGDNFSQTLL